MTANTFVMVYGFTLSNKKLLQFLLEKIAVDKHWPGVWCSMAADPEEDDDEWVHDDMVYGFNELRCLVGIGENKRGQAKMRELFPDTPTGIKFFFNPTGHKNTWHVGIPLRYAEEPDSVLPAGWNKNIKKWLELLDTVYERYEHCIVGDADPVVFNIPDRCESSGDE
jgi:hypothetical protein